MQKITILKVVTKLTVPVINPFYLNNLLEGKLTVNFPTLVNSARNSGEISPYWRYKNKFSLMLAIKNTFLGYPGRQIGDN